MLILPIVVGSYRKSSAKGFNGSLITLKADFGHIYDTFSRICTFLGNLC